MFDRKKYMREYYQEHKEKIYENMGKWKKNNKDKVVKTVLKNKRKRVEKLREQGVSNAWNVVNYGKEPKYKVKE